MDTFSKAQIRIKIVFVVLVTFTLFLAFHVILSNKSLVSVVIERVQLNHALVIPPSVLDFTETGTVSPYVTNQERDNPLLTNASYWARVQARISPRGIYVESDDIDGVLETIRKAKVTSFEIFNRETSLKWIVSLSGGQRFLFKPCLENSTKYKGQFCNTGYEQPRAESAAFHIERLFDMRKTPYVTGRRLNVRTEILPVATPAVSEFFQIHADGSVCLNFKCFHCAESHEFCYVDGIIPGTLMMFLNYPIHIYQGQLSFYHAFHPYGGSKGLFMASGGYNNTVCRLVEQFGPYTNKTLFMDLHDMAVLDYVLQHLDRRHSYIKGTEKRHFLTVHLDHGLALCSLLDSGIEMLISPIRVCCRMRRTTYERLLLVQRLGEYFVSYFRDLTYQDPLFPLLTDEEILGIMNRIQIVVNIVEKCREFVGDEVLVDV